MPYMEQIKAGMSFLFKSQKPDGGIPIGCIDDEESGVWTTSEVLDAVLSSEYAQMDISYLDNILKMVLFLCDRFIVSSKDGTMGYWEARIGEKPSAPTTGHAIYSLQIFMNKVLNDSGIESFKVSGREIVLEVLKREINNCILKAIKWLQRNQQRDNGWGYSLKDKSSVLCTYYVLKGFNAVGKNSKNDRSTEKACLFVKESIKRILGKKEPSRRDLSMVLYGYCCLFESSFFTRTDDDFKEQISKYINTNWKHLTGNTNINSSNKKVKYVYNMPYIALNTVLTVEDYSFEPKIRRLISDYVNKMELDGSWRLEKNGKTETTWVTAEAIIVLNKAQENFAKYESSIIMPKRLKTLISITVMFAAVSAIVLLCYIISLAQISNDVKSSITNIIFTTIGLLSSIITIATSIFASIEVYKQ